MKHGLKFDFENKITPLIHSYFKSFENVTIGDSLKGVHTKVLNNLISGMSDVLNLRGNQSILFVPITPSCTKRIKYDFDEGKRLNINVIPLYQNPSESVRSFYTNSDLTTQPSVPGEFCGFERPTVFFSENSPTHFIFYVKRDGGFTFEDVYATLSVYGSPVAWAKRFGLHGSVMSLSKHNSTHYLERFKDHLSFNPHYKPKES